MKAGHPVLKQVAEPVDFVNKKLRSFIEDMVETMYESDGVGLAAPQVGLSQRIIVLDDGNGLLELVNPEITKKEGSQIGLEGCLSVPGYYGNVDRYDKITVKALDKYNKKKIIKAEGFLARILQHEIDHLDGHLFIEKASDIHRISDDEPKKGEE